MADWAELSWRIAKITEQGDEFIRLIEKMDKEQSEFLLEDDPIFLCLDTWMLNPNNHGREVDASTLYNEFQTLAEKETLTFSFKNTRSFGWHLRNIYNDIAEFFNVRAEKKQRRWVYMFSPK
jgi:hypothetical protein